MCVLCAIRETIFGLNNPGGKLPVTMYPSKYVNEIDFLNMSMTTGPGRSYKYYQGTPLYPFGFGELSFFFPQVLPLWLLFIYLFGRHVTGKHQWHGSLCSSTFVFRSLLFFLLCAGLSYTSFKLEWSPNPPDHETRFTSAVSSTTYKCKVTNTGSVTGDEVVLAFHKPQGSSIATLPDGTPVPSKVLFGFERVTLKPGESTTVSFTLDATALGLVDIDGHRSVHNGDYDVVFSRGHGQELGTSVRVALPSDQNPHRLFTFPKWW